MQKLRTLRKTDEAPAANASRSVREVIVIETPLVLMVSPMRVSTLSPYLVLVIPDININISSTPIPEKVNLNIIEIFAALSELYKHRFFNARTFRHLRHIQ